MKEFITKIKNYSKKEILDFLEELCNDKILDEKIIMEKYFREIDLTEQENEILDKLRNNQSITAEDLKYIQIALEAKNNVKVSSLLKNKNKFIVSLVSYKINKYFNIAWGKYPRKVGKQLGYKAFVNFVQVEKLKDLDNLCKQILIRIQYYADMCKKDNTEEKYIMHFSTFFNSKKFL